MNSSSLKQLKNLSFIVFFAAFLTSIASASPAKVFSPEERQVLLSTSYKFVKERHYNAHIFSVSESQEVLETFMKKLDSGKTVFLKNDVHEILNNYASHLEEDMQAGDSSLIWNIWSIFKNRLKENQDFVKKYLGKTVHFDKNFSYNPKEEHTEWPATEAEKLLRIKTNIQYELLDTSTNSSAPSKDNLAKVAKRYNHLFSKAEHLENSKIISLFLNAYLGVLDPHSNYFTPENDRDFMSHHESLSYGGVGLRLNPENSLISVVGITPGGPAYKDGKIQVGDRIVGIAEDGTPPLHFQTTDELEVDEVLPLLKGPAGTKVHIMIKSPSQKSTKEVLLTREDLALKDELVSGWIIENPKTHYKLGLLKVPSFYKGEDRNSHSVYSDSLKILSIMKSISVDAYLIDLKGNPGGDLTQAVFFSNLFLGGVPIVYVADKEKHSHEVPGIRPGMGSFINEPLGVLTGYGSGSASEIAAGALKDYHRALIIGTPRTYGKGSVQKIKELNYETNNSKESLGSLHLTELEFFRPSGQSTQEIGVAADFVLPSIEDSHPLGEVRMPHYLTNDSIPIGLAQKLSLRLQQDLVGPYIDALQSLSKRRVQKIGAFSDVQNISQFIDENSKKALPLSVEEFKAQQRKTDEKVRQLSNKLLEDADAFLGRIPTYKFSKITMPMIDENNETPLSVSEKEFYLRGMDEITVHQLDVDDGNNKKEKETLKKEILINSLHTNESLEIMFDYLIQLRTAK